MPLLFAPIKSFSGPLTKFDDWKQFLLFTFHAYLKTERSFKVKKKTTWKLLWKWKKQKQKQKQKQCYFTCSLNFLYYNIHASALIRSFSAQLKAGHCMCMNKNKSERFIKKTKEQIRKMMIYIFFNWLLLFYNEVTRTLKIN